jgi:hypothetical protein
MEKLDPSPESREGDAFGLPLLSTMVISAMFAVGNDPITPVAPPIVASEVLDTPVLFCP